MTDRFTPPELYGFDAPDEEASSPTTQYQGIDSPTDIVAHIDQREAEGMAGLSERWARDEIVSLREYVAGLLSALDTARSATHS